MILRLALLLLCAAPAIAAGPEAIRTYGRDSAATHLLLRGTTDIALFDRLLTGYAASEPGLRITYEQWGSNDLYAEAARACRDGGTDADMLISSAVDLQVKLVNDGCARSYLSDRTARLPAALNWRDEVWGITREPAVFVYNRALVPATEAPRSRFDLIDLLRPADSRYFGKVATYDIEASGLGYLFAFMDSRQATTFGSLLEAFDRAEAVATCCSSEIIDGVVSGRYLLAYNVLGSYALARAAEAPDLVVVAPDDYTLVLARAAVIPRGAGQPEAAGRFLDYLLSEPGQRAMAAERLIVDIADPDPDPSAFLAPSDNQSAFRQIPLSPVLLVGLDQQKRALFLERWRETFHAR
ncbi:ABC transporter substrate-binding protein [Maliponia aquimaris]|uniref:Bacterial extracellular solute-binding protein n=1 Tax=Maliponia aquimaris TaxID=1673631 RepID=A0A238KG77_9RHOB|nr:ABC transporter substrate-binding protein [Maliponia aquimaris]SMX41072.1 Bacterial extracellular solute-binding protein [Maliponia aquimaris]